MWAQAGGAGPIYGRGGHAACGARRALHTLWNVLNKTALKGFLTWVLRIQAGVLGRLLLQKKDVESGASGGVLRDAGTPTATSRVTVSPGGAPAAVPGRLRCPAGVSSLRGSHPRLARGRRVPRLG